MNGMAIMYYYFLACVPIGIAVVAHHDYTQWKKRKAEQAKIDAVRVREPYAEYVGTGSDTWNK